MKQLSLYGIRWPAGINAIQATIHCIRKGGQWKDKSDRMIGAPLFDLYRDLQTLLWGDRCEHHEWTDILLKTYLEERITTIFGPKDTGKTNFMARISLCDYFAFPMETLILMSSTDMRGLELRVWGEVKDLFNLARDNWEDAPGNAVDSMHGIFTDEVGETDQARDIRRGLICIPVLDSEGQYKGMGKWVGIKQKRRRVFGDEVQFYASPYLSTLSNLNKGNFKGVFAGNPIGENEPLDKLGEPVDGYDSIPEITTTTTWRNKMGGITVNLYGPDSPAIKNPGKFTYLINQTDIDRIVDYWGKESAEYWNQAAGVRRPGISLSRIVTRDMIAQFNAEDQVVWIGGPRTKLYAIDAGYGGDRCVAGDAEFGLDINRKLVLSLSRPRVIPIKLFPKDTPQELRTLPEDQIAMYVMMDCERLGIPSGHVYHDATGRGSLGSAFARLWRPDTNPIDFGGNPTPRPVMSDLFIYDEKLKRKRLQRCDEHYSKFVSELHFSVRYAIEGDQMRGLCNEVADELCTRKWGKAKGNKKEVETKEDTKLRIGKSPDFADWCAIVVEGARRLGFTISKFESTHPESDDQDGSWRDELRDRAQRFRNSFALNYSA